MNGGQLSLESAYHFLGFLGWAVIMDVLADFPFPGELHLVKVFLVVFLYSAKQLNCALLTVQLFFLSWKFSDKSGSELILSSEILIKLPLFKSFAHSCLGLHVNFLQVGGRAD